MLDLVAERREQLTGGMHPAHALRADVDAERVGSRHRHAQAARIAAHRRRVRLDRPRGPGGVADLVARQHVEQLRRLHDGPRQHAVAGEERVAEVRSARDPAAARLQADQPAAGGGDPERAAAVVAVRHRDHARRHGSGRAARRASRRAFEVPRVVRDAGVPRLGRRQDPEFRHVRGPDHDEAGVAQAADQVGVVARPVPGEELRREVHAQAGDRDVRLDRDRHAGERALVARLDRVGGLERALGVHLDEGVDLVVQVLDPPQRRRDDLARRDLAPAYEGGELRNRLEHQVCGAHSAAAAYGN